MRQATTIIFCALLCLQVAQFSAHAATVDGSDWSYDPYAPAAVDYGLASAADVATTMLVLSAERGAEANPVLGSDPSAFLLVAVKAGLYFAIVPWMDQRSQEQMVGVINGIYYGAAANNLTILAGATSVVAIPVMIATAAWYWGCRFDYLPEGMCIE